MIISTFSRCGYIYFYRFIFICFVPRRVECMERIGNGIYSCIVHANTRDGRENERKIIISFSICNNIRDCAVCRVSQYIFDAKRHNSSIFNFIARFFSLGPLLLLRLFDSIYASAPFSPFDWLPQNSEMSRQQTMDEIYKKRYNNRDTRPPRNRYEKMNK